MVNHNLDLRYLNYAKQFSNNLALDIINWPGNNNDDNVTWYKKDGTEHEKVPSLNNQESVVRYIYRL